MTPEAVLEALVALAEEAGVRVRVLTGRRDPDAELPVASGPCRVRGEPWVVLAASDPLEDRIDALARGLRAFAGATLEGRYLPPAVRERLERSGGPA